MYEEGKKMGVSPSPASLAAYQRSADEVVTQLASDARYGLTTARADAALHQYGKNELPVTPPVPAWRKFIRQFKGPLTALLLTATVISFIVWQVEHDTPIPYEALTILAIVLLNAVLGYVQENRAEQAIAALKAMSPEMSTVLRDGQQQLIPTERIVPGDILLLEEGETIPADARLIEVVRLSLSEAALTGESAPVMKESAPLREEGDLADQRNMVFRGTVISSGRGKAIVTATGSQTEMGKIAGSLQQTKEEQTPLQRELDTVGKMLGIVVLIIAAIIGITIPLVSHVNTLTDVVEILLLAVALAVAAVPEGLTAITTVVLSLGMQRMAARRVIVRKLSAVETLGSTTVICTDKTGTLTRNEMTVRSIITASGRLDFTGVGYDPNGELLQDGKPVHDSAFLSEVVKTVRASSLANNADFHLSEDTWVLQGDPTEGALLVAAHKVHLRKQELEQRFPRLNEIPFSSERKLMSTLHKDRAKEERYVLFSKGAPDVLLAHCTTRLIGNEVKPLTHEDREKILAAIEQLAHEALRTIGVAFRSLPATDQPLEQLEEDSIWLGVIGMIDPPRAEAIASVRLAQQAGIRVIMITGDHPATAEAIASELGISKQGEVAVSGMQLQKLTDTQLIEAVRSFSVYARVAPEHKLRIVRALKANGEIVAMTGDGVNDAPALKAADIGVAMGITGTDVSKGAADMILVDDNFASIVAAVEEGRSIFSNIQKFLRFLLSSNIGEVITMFFGVVLAGAIGLISNAGSTIVAPLIATQILWINLLTDAAPALALGVDPSDRGLMHRPPRDPRTRVITRRMWWDIVCVGIIMAVGSLLLVDWTLPGGWLPGSGKIEYAQTMVFTTLVFFQLFNVFNTRSSERSASHDLFSNRWIWLAVLSSLILQAGVVYLPFLQVAFGTVNLSVTDWLVSIFVASWVIWVYEGIKFIRRRRTRSLP
jgi:Ca2+-transporting ATPase